MKDCKKLKHNIVCLEPVTDKDGNKNTCYYGLGENEHLLCEIEYQEHYKNSHGKTEKD